MKNNFFKKILTFFLRKDLNLKEKWWHRLFKVIFFAGIVVIIYIAIYDSYNNEQYKTVDTLGNRLTSQVNVAKDLLKKDESFGYPRYPIYQLEDMDTKTYCSKNIWNNLKEISKISSYDYYGFYSREINAYVKTPLESYSEQLKNSDVVCLTKDSSNGIYFLNNLSIEYNRDTKIYTKDYLLTTLNILLFLLMYITTYVVIVFFLYYKIFLYIIYGKKNKTIDN